MSRITKIATVVMMFPVVFSYDFSRTLQNPVSEVGEAVASAAARSESCMKTIALPALIRLMARHAMIRSVANVQRPRSSAFTVSTNLKISDW